MTSLVRTLPWGEIAAYYRGLEGNYGWPPAMATLVDAIAASPYASSIFGATSAHTLLVSQHPAFDPSGPVLSVQREGGDLVLQYRASGPTSAGWAKRCPPPEGLGALEQFLRLHGWISPAP